MTRCRACGATLAPDADWCGQCFASMGGSERSVMAPLPTPQQRAAPPAPEPASRVTYSRWRASTTSFGLFGRLVMTVLLLVPVWWFWSVQIFAWPGLVIWVGFLLPWALRDTWRRTRLPQR